MRKTLSSIIKEKDELLQQFRERVSRLEFEISVIKKLPTWNNEEVISRLSTAIDAQAHTITELRIIIQGYRERR